MTILAKRSLRLIVNGKAAGDQALRTAVGEIRQKGARLEVRVTWEGGDAARYAAEAVQDEVDVVVAAGGDGTVNEVVDGIMSATQSPKVAVAVVPAPSVIAQHSTRFPPAAGGDVLAGGTKAFPVPPP